MPARKPAKKAAPKKATPKKAVAKKPATKKTAPKRSAIKSAPKKTTLTKATTLKPLPAKKTWKIYIESCGFFPTNSSEGYVDLYQDGRHAAEPGAYLLAPLPLPVGAKLNSISIHYTNNTNKGQLAFFLRKHADRHCPSGEIEMSFIDLPNAALPPDNYLTVTDATFPDAGIIGDRYLHYISIPTGDWGSGGKVTVRGVSLSYSF